MFAVALIKYALTEQTNDTESTRGSERLVNTILPIVIAIIRNSHVRSQRSIEIFAVASIMR